MNFYSVYGFIALISGIFIVLQLVISLFFGGLDIDIDTDTDVDAPDSSDTNAGSGGAFELMSLLSPKGILHFLFGGSWYLVLAEYSRGGILLTRDWFIAIGVGFLCSLVICLLYWGMSKLQCEKEQESGEILVGRSGEIYLHVSGVNKYEINVVINGMKRQLSVVSESDKEYKVGEICVIKSYKDNVYYIE